MTDDYAVEAIRGWRYNWNERQKEYLIKWANYPECDNTWEPEENLNCPEILDKFADSLTGKEARYFNTTQPQKLTGFQRNATFQACLGADGPHESDDEDSLKIEKQHFYVLLKFEDSDLAEECTIREFLTYNPKAAMKFLEQRLVYKGKLNPSQ